MKKVDFSETIEACDLKVGRYRQLIDFMKVIVCACPYSSNIGLSAMTLYYPVQDKTTT